jgi:50S ribosomal protein L16 3-hydroxylase
MPGPLTSWTQTIGPNGFDAGDALEGRLFRRVEFLAPDPTRLTALGDLASASVDDLLAERRSDVIAWFSSTDGPHQTASVSPLAARRLYRAGIALYLIDVPELEALSDRIATELGVPPRNVQCTLFCHPTGSATRAHFDAVHNLTIQLAGRKRWRVAPNRHAYAPTVGWATLDREVPSELALYGHQPLPTTMPDDANEFVLEPGALLTVPRGWWHETESDEASISLHVHYEPILWVDTVLATLRARLLQDHDWREALPARARGDDARALAAGRLERLAAVVGNLDPGDLLASATGDPSEGSLAVTRRAGTSLGVTGSPPDNGNDVEVEIGAPQPGGELRTTLALSAAPLRAARLLASVSPPRAVRRDELIARVPDLTGDQADALVGALLEAGFLKPAEFVII